MKYLINADASERVLADGRVLIPGEPVELDPDQAKEPHNKRLIDEGQLVEQKAKKGGGS